MLLKEIKITIASARLKVQLSLTEGHTLSIATQAFVNTHCFVSSIFRRWAFTAVTCYVKKRVNLSSFLIIFHQNQTNRQAWMTAAVLVLHQQEAITCADWFAFTGSIDGLLAHCSSLCISAVLAARAVSVTVKKSINPTFNSIVVFQKNSL